MACGTFPSPEALKQAGSAPGAAGAHSFHGRVWGPRAAGAGAGAQRRSWGLASGSRAAAVTPGCPHTGVCPARHGNDWKLPKEALAEETLQEAWEKELFPQPESGNAGVRQSKETPKLSKHEEEQTEHPGCALRGPGQKHGLGLGQNGPRLSPSSPRRFPAKE